MRQKICHLGMILLFHAKREVIILGVAKCIRVKLFMKVSGANNILSTQSSGIDFDVILMPG